MTLLPSRADDHDDLEFRDPSGQIRTVSTNGRIDTSNPFFKSLGTNGRSCVTCHQPSDAWSITPEHLQERFDKTNGRDPVFRLNDGANFQLDSNPDGQDLERIAQITGLSKRVTQVWFQNSRARQKKHLHTGKMKTQSEYRIFVTKIIHFF